MRLFITINTDLKIKNEIAQYLPQLKNYYTGKWVPKENWHITLLFLGEVNPNKLDLIDNKMKESILGIKPFKLYIEDLGVFPTELKPNILWAGVKGDLKALNRLYLQLVDGIREIEIPFDAKPSYTPHLTLARKLNAFSKVDELSVKSSEWQVNSIELYQSIFIGNNVKYQRLIEKSF